MSGSIFRQIGEIYHDTGDPYTLEATIRKFQEVLDLALGDPNNPTISFTDQCLREMKDLDAAIVKYREAVDLPPTNHPDRASWLQGLAVIFGNRYQRLGDMKDLEAGVEKYQEAVDLTPADHPKRAAQLQGLAAAFGNRYQRSGDMNDMEAAMEKLQEAVDLTPADHPDRAARLQGLAAAFANRYQRLGDMTDLEAAVEKYQEAVDLTPADHPKRTYRLHGLAISFTNCYERLGDMKDLEAAVEKFQAVTNLTPAEHPERPYRLQDLATSFTYRYQRLGDMKDLEAAVEKYQEAVDLTPSDHPARATRLHGLAISFTDRYKRLGDMKDLEAAVEKSQEVVDLTPAGHPKRASWLQTLALTLKDRYQRLGDINDMEAAMEKSQEAVDLTPADHPDLASRLHVLATLFLDRYRRRRDMRDLDGAVEKFQEAMDRTPADHPDRACRLQGVATSLADRYTKLRDMKDLKTAVEKFQEVVNLTPADHPNRPSRLDDLAMSLTDRYQRLGDLNDLEAAVHKYQEAMDQTPTDHPDRTCRLQAIAAAFMARYKQLENPEDLQLIHTYYGDSFKTQAPSNPESSWRAALQWAFFSEDVQPVYSLTAYSVALDLLPDLLWMGHPILVRQDAIRRLHIGPAVSTATQSCIALSDLISAVQLFEQGLATTFQQILQLKPDFNLLPPDQAKELQRLSSALYNGTANNPGKVAYQRQELLHAIRKQPGLEHFLLRQPYQVLCHAAQEGPVVLLNSHPKGCDGIMIVNPVSDPVHVAFPNVTLHELGKHQSLLKQLLHCCGVRTHGESISTRLFGGQEGVSSTTIEEHFTYLLAWLWNNIAKPVYQVLASYEIHKGRLWWLPSGLFTGLPLHACPPTDKFIHSYTATLGLLLEAQAKKPLNKHNIGVVGVTHTGHPSANYLKGVKREVENIRSIVKDPTPECLIGEEATSSAVKDLLQKHSWVHLACHGVQDLVEPTKSRLLLYDGVLELETILRMSLSNAEDVFLAACQTAMGDAALANESFHLGGGFIAAGFQGAIGTLWSMNDEDGPLVAESVYSHLFRDGRHPHASDAAEALQLAVNKLKAQKVPYERWIPFIHMGI
ncbi:CHAT domain-containing protein [Mycena maculata]|uniref:CHAT domain-containing protein n=1 Tax=Mycena maculata TaxID=230809 RepID=A0AAD7MJ87_9AGAR|nr:CHAT domain-containing protein [Mycena maculata]